MVMNAEEKGKQSIEDRTLKDLSPNVAALLCYVAGWISGIVFLVLEQKNRFVRFHALQSIIVFGVLTLAGGALRNIPLVGWGLATIVWVTGFILWILLMVKAQSGEYFKIPWAGDLAEKLTAESTAPSGTGDTHNTTNSATNHTTMESSTEIPATRPSKGDIFRAKYYSNGARTGRIVGSSFAIAWSVALIIFLNFFNQYIAYYQPSYSGGVTHWQITPFVTPDFDAWLPIVTTALVIGIIGHAIMIAFDKYVLREIIDIILNVFGLAVVISLLVIFPFDFSVIPNTDAAFWASIGLTITLIIVAVGIGIGTIVKFIQLIVNVAEGKY